uniref:Uncharacterized protein n=1 Tax=Arion vulgaris TaxID=1028688 RepID=A0A0B7ANX8_9EUPU
MYTTLFSLILWLPLDNSFIDIVMIKEDSDALSMTTSSTTLEVLVVAKSLLWLESKNNTRDACTQIDSSSMIEKVEVCQFCV